MAELYFTLIRRRPILARSESFKNVDSALPSLCTFDFRRLSNRGLGRGAATAFFDRFRMRRYSPWPHSTGQARVSELFGEVQPKRERIGSRHLFEMKSEKHS
jgi:hypothetical protein